jgi:DNA-binding transcriptional LysR family regulator
MKVEAGGAWVLFPQTSHTRTAIVDSLGRLGAPLDVVADSHQPEVLREMVVRGLGGTVLPVTQAEAGDRPRQTHAGSQTQNATARSPSDRTQPHRESECLRQVLR